MTEYNSKIVETIMESYRKKNQHIRYKDAVNMANEYIVWQRRVEAEFKRLVKEQEKEDG